MGYIAVLPLAAALGIHFHKKAETMIAPAIFIMAGIVFVSGLFSDFAPGVTVVKGLLILSCLYVVLRILIPGRDWFREDIVALVITPGTAVYLAAGLLFSFCNHGREFMKSDEFAHWGLVVKEFCMRNDFSDGPASRDLYAYYQPIIGVWEYLSIQLQLRAGESGVFSEAIVIQEHAMIIIACMSAALRKLSWKKPWRIALYAAIIVFLPAVFTGADVYINTQVDGVIGVTAAFLIWLWFCEERDSSVYFRYAVLVSALVLSKDFGIVLAFVVSCVILADLYIYDRRNLFYRVKNIMFWGSSSLLPYILWALYTAYKNLGGPLLGILQSLGSLGALHVFAAEDAAEVSDLQFENITRINNTIHRYYTYICTEKAYGDMLLKPSIIMVVASIGALIILFRRILPKRNKEGTCLTLLFAGFFVYAGILLFCYCTLFGETGQWLPSYQRYFASYLLLLLIVVVLFYLEWIPDHDRILCYAAAMILVFGSTVSTVQPLWQRVSGNMPQRYRFSALERAGIELNADEFIYYVEQSNTGYTDDFRNFMYTVDPLFVIQQHTLLRDDKVPGEYLDAGEWSWLLTATNCSYVYLHDLNPDFKDRFGSIFEDAAQIEKDSLFSIQQKEDGSIVLHRIG